MPQIRILLQQLYTAFNERRIEDALALMLPEVHWPKASEGGFVTGTEGIRAYWTRQWSTFDPRVDPVAMHIEGEVAEVQVHQVVRDKNGALLSDQRVTHRFTMSHGLVARMDIVSENEPAFGNHDRQS